MIVCNISLDEIIGICIFIAMVTNVNSSIVGEWVGMDGLQENNQVPFY